MIETKVHESFFEPRVVRPQEPRVLRLYPAFSTTRTCRLASGIDRDSELIEVVW